MHYYQHNIADYRADTAHLSLAEHGIYRSLIDWYYLDEKPIPKETQVVCRRLRIASESDIQSLKNVLSDFFSLLDDGFHHVRCDKEIAAYRGKAEKNRVNGKKGGRPKALLHQAENHLGFSGLANGNPNESQNNPNHKPITNNQEKEENITPIAPQPPSSPVAASENKKSSKTFRKWLEAVKASGESPIPSDDPIFQYAADAGLPDDFLRLHWIEFRARYIDDDKRYTDWRRVFRKSARGNWFKLWWINNGQYTLTTLGQQAMSAMQAKEKREP